MCVCVCVRVRVLQSLSEKLLGLTSENIHKKEEQVSQGGHVVVSDWTKGGPRVCRGDSCCCCCFEANSAPQ